MPANKRITDLSDYTSVLPYDSELFGIYHPLLGWRSKRIQERFTKGLQNDKSDLLKLIQSKFKGLVDIKYRPDCNIGISIQPGSAVAGRLKTTDSIVFQKVAEKLPPFAQYDEAVWHHVLSDDHLHEIFNQSVIPQYTQFYETTCRGGDHNQLATIRRFQSPEHMMQAFKGAFANQLEYESVVAGSLQFLLKNKLFTALKSSFYTITDHAADIIKIAKALDADSPESAYLNLENLDPKDKEQLSSVLLSPISVVHLFRQYFFELDSFLGTPVGHVWLSPGSTVELIEVSTRKTITERTIENALETTVKTEKSTTEQDELSEAVKEDNKQDIKFGAGVTASYASITANSSFDLNTSQERSREQVHKQMRQQTEKLSSEIRKNYKSTFKTVTEVTDMSSKRYLLTNNTPALINYEMRRKMRQVGVQVQDVGTYLCWQAYVDDPGRDLGLGKLIHIAKTPELDAIPHPEEIVPFDTITEKQQLSIPFQQTSEDEGDKDEGYRDGREVDTDFNEGDVETIRADFQQSYPAPKSGYTLSSIEINKNGNAVELSHGPIDNASQPGTAVFNLHLDYANFRGQDQMQIELTLNWDPDPATNEEIKKKNDANMAAFKAKEAEAYQKTFVENVKERVKLASKIERRPSEDLREEERIVVYRHLIQDMLTHGITMPDDRSRHVVAELINSIFDVDKMLYFVAPEWWRPRLHHSYQQLDLTKTPQKKVSPFAIEASVSIMTSGIAKYLNEPKQNTSNISELKSSTVGWGDAESDNRDNYYITEDSDVARLGSSLGWLMQLDGDNLRNAFLNAPWVKAVIPIRPGKETAAINWLKGVEGFNGIGDTDIYHASSPDEKDIDGNSLEGQKMMDVLMDLAKKIQAKHRKEVEIGTYPKAGDIADPSLVDESTTITSTPIDRVYEHGFYPLQGGFRAPVKDDFEIFDQWLEILPTDQVVPVEVKYDPKTGRQV
jgi:hypothetical protein